AALAELRAQKAEIERRAREAEERRRREEAEAERRRQAQQRWVDRQVEIARTALQAQQFLDATEALDHVQQVSPDTPGVADLLQQVRAAQAAAEIDREREQHERAQREAER